MRIRRQLNCNHNQVWGPTEEVFKCHYIPAHFLCVWRLWLGCEVVSAGGNTVESSCTEIAVGMKAVTSCNWHEDSRIRKTQNPQVSDTDNTRLSIFKHTEEWHWYVGSWCRIYGVQTPRSARVISTRVKKFLGWIAGPRILLVTAPSDHTASILSYWRSTCWSWPNITQVHHKQKILGWVLLCVIRPKVEHMGVRILPATIGFLGF